MSIKNVTITSKNQITLPSEYVRMLQLTQSRILQAELREGKIVLSPQPSLSKSMQQFWGKHSASKALTDKEIKQAIRGASAVRASKSS
jgi:bifunctional DNA-binding transcriptional regulator/antitoxin component of YhaV-PrlF toxin-antitoxin module